MRGRRGAPCRTTGTCAARRSSPRRTALEGDRPARCRPAIARLRSSHPPVGPNRSSVDRGGVVAQADEQVGGSLDEGRRPADEDPWPLRRCRADMAEHVRVDPAREARPAGGRLARERLMHGEPVAGGEPSPARRGTGRRRSTARTPAAACLRCSSAPHGGAPSPSAARARIPRRRAAADRRPGCARRSTRRSGRAAPAHHRDRARRSDTARPRRPRVVRPSARALRPPAPRRSSTSAVPGSRPRRSGARRRAGRRRVRASRARRGPASSRGASRRSRR